MNSEVGDVTVNGIKGRGLARISQEEISIGPPDDPDSETLPGKKSWSGTVRLEKNIPAEVSTERLLYEGPILDLDGTRHYCTGTILIESLEIVDATDKEGEYMKFLRGGLNWFRFVGTDAPKIHHEAIPDRQS